MTIRTFVSTISAAAILLTACATGSSQPQDPPSGQDMRDSIRVDGNGKVTSSLVGPLEKVDVAHVSPSMQAKLGGAVTPEMRCVGGCDGEWCCTCCGSYCECGREVDAIGKGTHVGVE